jgi:carbamate kinase
MRVVAALGGNALIQRGQPLDVATQRANLTGAARALAEIAREHELLVTHGNGPQVGLLALQAAAYADPQAPGATPLDVLGAESEGMVGYLIEMALANAMPGKRLATLLTMVEVDPADPAFAAPTKPIGPIYTQEQMRAFRRAAPWQFARDAAGTAGGDAWRRVVPSPQPQRVLELEVLRLLLGQGVTVVCAGGGGIPVRRRGPVWEGVEAVVDKDHTSGLLARELGADVLLLLTDVPGVARDFGQPQQGWLRRTTPAELAVLPLAAGSIAPKAQAAAAFVRATGGRAAIGRLADAGALLRGEAGTQVLSG